MTTEFNLSDKIFELNMGYDGLVVQDVKEFIRLLKEKFSFDEQIKIIDSLAGDKLK